METTEKNICNQKWIDARFAKPSKDERYLILLYYPKGKNDGKFSKYEIDWSHNFHIDCQDASHWMRMPLINSDDLALHLLYKISIAIKLYEIFGLEKDIKDIMEINLEIQNFLEDRNR